MILDIFNTFDERALFIERAWPQLAAFAYVGYVANGAGALKMDFTSVTVDDPERPYDYNFKTCRYEPLSLCEKSPYASEPFQRYALERMRSYDPAREIVIFGVAPIAGVSDYLKFVCYVLTRDPAPPDCYLLFFARSSEHLT
jgi:hypothetical protein